jgi:hypothetical protein
MARRARVAIAIERIRRAISEGVEQRRLLRIAEGSAEADDRLENWDLLTDDEKATVWAAVLDPWTHRDRMLRD